MIPIGVGYYSSAGNHCKLAGWIYHDFIVADMTGKKKRPQDPPKSQPTAAERTRFEINSGSLRIGCQAFFALFCFSCIVWSHSDVFRIIGEYAFFQDSCSYLYDQLGTVGGPLRYVSGFLTSFFLFLPVGALILVALLLLIQMACARLFRFDGALVLLSFLPSLLLFSALAKTSYLVFADLNVSLLLGNVLGILFVLWFGLGYQRIASPTFRCLYGITGVYVIYYCTGIFGMLALILCLFLENGFPNTRRRTLRIEGTLLAGILAPPLFYRLMMSGVNFSRIFFVSVPTISDSVFNYYAFYYLLVYASLLVWGIVYLIRFGSFRTDTEAAVPPTPHKVAYRAILPAGLLCLAMILEILVFSGSRSNSAILFRMWTLMEQGRWQEIVSLPKTDPFPVRPVVLIRNLALFKTGRLGNEAFSFSQASRQHVLLEIIASHNVCGAQLMYEYGFVNTAYRFSMNRVVMRGENIYDLKMLARCSLANGETALARKYLQIVRRSPFHRRWVERRLAYLDGDDSARSVAEEVEQIRKRMPKENLILKTHPDLDAILLDLVFAEDFRTSSDEARELTLFLLLQQKQLDRFKEYFDFRFQQQEPWEIPVHFQEAMLIASQDPLKATADYRLLPSVCERYQQFVAFDRRYGEMKQKNPLEFVKQLERQFGNTYWFFYFAVRRVHTY